MIFRSVVLPHPLGPRITRVSASNTDRSRSRMEKVELRPPDEPAVARSPPRSVAQMLISSIRAMRTAQGTRATDDSPTLGPVRSRRAASSLRFLLVANRQGELKDGTVRHVRGGPQPSAMGLDDRAAYRQPHAHALSLGRV